MTNIIKRNLLKIVIILIITISIITSLAIIYKKLYLDQTVLNIVNRNTSVNKIIFRDLNNHIIELNRSKKSKMYISNVHNFFNKSIHLQKIPSNKVIEVKARKSSTISFNGKSEYFIMPDGTIIAKVFKEDMGKTNLLNRVMLSFNKEKYLYYYGKSKQYVELPQKIISMIKKSIEYSNEKEIYNSIKMLTPLKRKFGSEDERKASQLIKNKLAAYGYQTNIQKFIFIHKIGRLYRQDGSIIPINKFLKKQQADLQKHFPPCHSQNVISIKKSNAPKGIIIICAHYDCSSENGSTGAIDDGSGVSAVIEIAKCLKDISSNYEIRFVFFGGEEAFLRGSTYYVDNLSKNDRNNIKAVINLDTIGSKSNDKFAMVTFNGKENKATNILKKFANKMGIQVEKGPISDYKSFHILEKGSGSNFNSFHVFDIPSVCIGQIPTNISGMKSELHIDNNQDTINNVDTHKIKIITDMIITALKELI